MKKDYTILVPTMLPVHFTMAMSVFRANGYNTVLLENKGDAVKNAGLKYVHNDTCYPAQVVIGQMIDAIENGGYDKHKIALLITQTGGGCRASNYISLLRKALEKAGYGYIPVLSLNISGLDNALKLTLPMLKRLMYAVSVGDLLMCLGNQTRPYENEPGSTDELIDYWTNRCSAALCDKKVSYDIMEDLMKKIIEDFEELPRTVTDKPKVGIVGEIFVKFSPLGNNDLEAFLHSQGAEVVMGGLLDFCMYCIYNYIVDAKLYGMGKIKAFFCKKVYSYLLEKQLDIINLIRGMSRFNPPGDFAHTVSLTKGFIGLGAKMGEGWLLTAEIIELIESGVKNVICAQPFGCLPNHIVGKGMMKRIKEAYPDVNLVAIDYDAGASRVNQENRIKLMLANSMEKNNKIITQEQNRETVIVE
ncbi:MAG: 2-hydroxyacyl-CoA dehydratase [Clostridia bacterium]|nr:2-hydroxyacyl-CoA dehydratase [Clostridia bacterium]